MNSDTQQTAEQCAKDAGAIVKCSICHNYDISAQDGDAERLAYGRATEAWKRSERGFQGMTREEVMAVMKGVLEDASHTCPSCG